MRAFPVVLLSAAACHVGAQQVPALPRSLSSTDFDPWYYALENCPSCPNADLQKLTDPTATLNRSDWHCLDAVDIPSLLSYINARTPGTQYVPELEPSDPRLVRADIAVDSLFKIDARAQQYDMKISGVLSWTDCTAVFNGYEATVGTYHIITEMAQPWWEPQVEYQEMRGQRAAGPGYWDLWYPGTFYRHFSKVGTFACPMDFAKLPFDTQLCKLHIGMTSRPRTDVQFVAGAVVLPAAGLKNAQWKIGGFALKEVIESRPVAGIPTNFSTLELSFTLERDPNYYQVSVVVPVIIIWLLSFTGLFIPVEALPARGVLGLIPVLIVVNTQTRVLDGLPSISYMTKLTLYMTLTKVLLMIHMIEFGLIAWSRKHTATKDKMLEEKRKLLQKPTSAEEGAQSIGSASEGEGNEEKKMPPKPKPDFFHRFAAFFAHICFEEAFRVIALLAFIVVNIIYAVH
eukprot:CAMPEP_0117465976 /NCGR_PEP_ID=MMETSP0784-20121206/4903_1 /TAXON_ID=39447 /ORGANISM="" /LENGTH=457 /DNA_ID=CAMNT_0005259901 /DNA_START=91 /DNA_END=1464 /DNA_ORIENTATION=+